MSKENLSESSSSIVTNSNCARRLERKRVIMLERHTTGWWYGTAFYCHRAKNYSSLVREEEQSLLAVAFPKHLSVRCKARFLGFFGQWNDLVAFTFLCASWTNFFFVFITRMHVWPFLKYAAPNLFWFWSWKISSFPSSVQSLFFLHLPRGAWTPSGCSYITFLRLIRIFDIYFFKIDSQI